MHRLGLPALTLALVGLWLLLPFVESGVPAQDAIPVLVAGELVTGHPDDVYNDDARDLYDLTPRFRDATCAAYGDPEACATDGVAFISPPLALPLVAPVAQLDVDAGVVLLRLLGAVAMAAGFVLLGRRLGLGADGLVPLTIAAGLLLLDVAGQVELGQTSPLLFFLACLPIARLRGPRAELAVAVGVAVAVAFKGFPIVLLIPMAAARRWRLAGLTLAGVAVLGAASAVLGAGGLWPEFLDLSRTVAEVSRENPYNAAAGALAESLRVPGHAAAGTAVGVILAVLFVWAVLAGDPDEDLRWAATIPVALLVLPQVWSHYLATSIPVVVVAAMRCSQHPERWLVGSVAALAPYSAVAGAGTGWQAYGFLYVVGSLVAVAALVRARPNVRVAVT